MKNTRFSLKTFPLALLAVCTLAFGLLIPWLGFYQDDWYQIWFGRAFGNGVWIDYYAGERPFIALLYMLTTPLLGASPLAWQVFGLLARVLAALAVWVFLRQLWPRLPHQAAWAALLFAVYPGFRVQWAAVIYSHYFVQLAIQALSLAAMLLALRQPQRYWPLTAAAVAGAAFGLFSSEYFFGLEVARPIFIWLVLGEQSLLLWPRLKKTVLHWLPYLAILAAFLAWRILIFQFPTYQPFYKQFPGLGPLGLLAWLAKTVLTGALEMGLVAWGNTLQVFPAAASLRPVGLAALGLALLAGLGLFLYLRRLEGQEARGRSFGLPAILTGIFLILAGGWPFWFVNLPVNTNLNEGARFGISFMLGAALLAAGLIDLLGQRTWIKAALVAALVGLSIGYHFLDADFYREVNRTQASFFQQLAWRAPGLEPGTLVLTNSVEKNVLSGDNSLTAALNWIYDPQPPYSLDYMLFYLPTRIDTGNLESLEPGTPVEKVFRTQVFHGSTDRVLAIYYPYPHCLRVLDPHTDLDLPRPLDMPRELRDAIPISNLGQIAPDADPPAALPPDLFKYRPGEASWCYFYEKAGLALQQKDWAAAAALADAALSRGEKVQTAWELLPFIEGYARGGQPEKARELTLEAVRLHPDGRTTDEKLACALWSRLEDEASTDDLTDLAKATQAELECPSAP